MKHRQLGIIPMNLRVRHAIVRFDNVPKNIESAILERTVLDNSGDMLEWEYLFRRSVPISIFWAKFRNDMADILGNEVRRLRKHKLLPVLYVDVAPREYHFFYMQLFRSTIQRFARERTAFILGRQDHGASPSLVVEIPKTIITLLARNKFKMEIS